MPEDDRADDETSVLPIAALPRAPAIAGPPPTPPSAAPAVMPALDPRPAPPLPPPLMPALYTAYRSAPGIAPAVGRVVFAGVVLLMFGVAQIVSGAAGAIFAGALRRLFDNVMRDQGIRIEQSALGNVVASFFVVVLLLGVLHVAAAAGVFSQRSWGRWLGILLSIFGVGLLGALMVRLGSQPETGARLSVAVLALLVPYVISLLALIFAGAHFERRQRRR